MNLVERVKNICLTPATEWNVIDAEHASTSRLITEYVVPLAGISTLAGLVGGSVLGRTLPVVGTLRVPFLAGLGVALFTFVMAIVSVFAVAALIDALAPSFGATKNPQQAMKVAVYSFTPSWVAGILQVLPVLAVLVLVGSLYSLYVLYLGLPKLMKCPDDQAVGYTAVIVICAIVLSAVIGFITASIGGLGMLGLGML